MKRYIFIPILILLALTEAAFAQVPQTPDPKTSMKSFLQEATLSGLQTNALSKKLVQNLLDEDALWVGKCPICDEVKRGMRKYIKEDSGKAVSKLDKPILKGLRSKDTEEQKSGLKQLIDQYIQQYFVKLAMTADERTYMEDKLAAGRKTGMSRARNANEEGFYCASCDGACHVPIK